MICKKKLKILRLLLYIKNVQNKKSDNLHKHILPNEDV